MISVILFTLVSIAAFIPWAFPIRGLTTPSTLYPAIALIFVLGGAPSLLPAYMANNGKRGRGRFLLLFWPAFIVFAAFWWGLWELFHNHTGEIFGSLLGLTGLILVFKTGFRMTQSLPHLIAILFTWYTPNYYIAEYIHNELKFATFDGATAISRLSWGLFMGIGLGAALSSLTSSLRVREKDSTPLSVEAE